MNIIDEAKILAENNSIDFHQFTAYHYRFTNQTGKIKLDLYPVNQRYHVVAHPEKEINGQRGDCMDLKILFESIFNY